MFDKIIHNFNIKYFLSQCIKVPVCVPFICMQIQLASSSQLAMTLTDQ